MTLRIVLAALIACVFGLNAAAEERKALLVGAQHYSGSVSSLSNPHKDVDLLSAKLQELGFDVTVLKDAPGEPVTKQDVEDGLTLMGEAAASDPNAITFFYYSGHGAADNTGSNYLIVSDVTDTSTSLMWNRSVEVTDIQDKLLRAAPNAAHFIIVDACREELVITAETKSLSKGFRPVPETDLQLGVMLAFATQAGALASDGDPGAPAGPYATILAEEIVIPGREHGTLFLKVRERMAREHNQVPFQQNMIIGGIFLREGEGEIITAPPISEIPEESGGESDDSDGPDASAPISQRRALVISNSEYGAPFSPLADAVASGEEITASLQGADFSVTHLQNPSRSAIIEQFRSLYEGFNPDAIEKAAMIHYIGYARASGPGEDNYLIPTGTKIENGFDLKLHGVKLDMLINTLNPSEDIDTYMIIDGCSVKPIDGFGFEGCSDVPEKDRLVLAMADIDAAPESGASPSDEAPAPTYTAVLSEEIIKGGALSDVLQRSREQTIETKVGAGVKLSGESAKSYELTGRDRSTIEAIKTAPPVVQAQIPSKEELIYDVNLEAPLVQSNNKTCFNSIQNKIAWDERGNRNSWSSVNIENLCSGGETTAEPGKCFASYMRAARSDAKWPAQWTIGSALCQGSPSNTETNRRLTCARETSSLTIDLARACASGRSTKTCFEAVQNKVAWNEAGTSKSWAASNINNLCQGAETSTTPARCFDAYMSRARRSAWPAQWTVGIALCKGAKSSSIQRNRFACIQRASSVSTATANSCSAQYK